MLFLLKKLVVMLLLAHASIVLAQSVSPPEPKRELLVVAVRESIGGNRIDDKFTPSGKGKVKLPSGKEIEVDFAMWEYIGDTHIRFMFDTPQMMFNASTKDLETLGLTKVEDALALALSNIKRVYGAPKVVPWTLGIMKVEGQSPDLHSSYFLDRDFWLSLEKKHPEGVVVSVPKRGGLLYAPLSETKAIDELKRGVGKLFTSSERFRVSSALYLFKAGEWTVFQAPQVTNKE